ncbi:substrate-binding domain-containing protein [Rhodovibrio salinarum]|uniref:Sugar ABC transporter substrate-binding protein n=1 Tax=Rhodovibrio salinarum TaxID=1087 RepID=A0A934V045_9PROT|nr:substrate-binding domain-containing protein [Rhodovibrio salinarum]MBK1697211.1 sugar ABC transporter substrate-binding protein [Rhodovibrio salinarum]
MRRALLAAAAIIGLAVGTAHADDQTMFGAVLKTPANPHWGAMTEGIKAAGEQHGIDIIVSTVENESAAEQQLNNCQSMLLREPDALLVGAINSNILLPCLKSATEQGIPIADLDFNLNREITKEAGVDVTFTVGAPGRATGKAAAEFLANRLGADASGSVLVLRGLPGNSVSIARTKGFESRLSEVAPNLKIADTLHGDWDRGKSANITNDILLRTPDLVAVFAANDTMALGATESAIAAGRGDIETIGVDGSSSAIKSIRSGRLTASVATFPYLVGKTAVDVLEKVVREDAQVDDYQHTEMLVLTQDVLETGENPLLDYIQ